MKMNCPKCKNSKIYRVNTIHYERGTKTEPDKIDRFKCGNCEYSFEKKK